MNRSDKHKTPNIFPSTISNPVNYSTEVLSSASSYPGVSQTLLIYRLEMSRKESKEKTLIKYVKAPFRVLIRIRNFYIYTMIQCSGHIGPGGNVPARQINGLPRAYSINMERQRSTSLALNEDFRELVKAASTRRLTGIIQLEDDVLRRPKSDEKKLGFPEPGHMQRSSTVSGMGRIDEEEPCEFGADDVKVRVNMLPTSWSHR